MTTNAEGRFQYARPARHSARRSRAPGTLVMGVLVLTFLPILALFWFAVPQGVMSLPFMAAALGAVATGTLMERAKTNREAWAMSLCTVALPLIAAFPPVYGLTMGFTNEWCESQPAAEGTPDL
jgi:hypothetical protein